MMLANASSVLPAPLQNSEYVWSSNWFSINADHSHCW
jgi:hypothetical protein